MKWLISVFFGLTLLVSWGWATTYAPNIGIPLAQEQLDYEVGVLWFDNIAQARLSFVPSDEAGTYDAVLEGKTKGTIAFLTDHRKQRIETRMRLLPDGSFQTVYTRNLTIKGKGSRARKSVKEYRYDFERREVLRVNGEGSNSTSKVIPMPQQGLYYDALTAMYNLRLGYFGPLDAGNSFIIPTISRKGPEQIEIQVLTNEQRRKQGQFPLSGVLCRVMVSAEIFDTKGGSIYVWFDEQLVPSAGVIENAVGMGDLRGKIRTEKR